MIPKRVKLEINELTEMANYVNSWKNLMFKGQIPFCSFNHNNIDVLIDSTPTHPPLFY